ncbi:hypothetical protein [Robinsoniella peoriensis]|uniref:hypothetical protein n=1 Tax=Robinsoniella peoriensis TaxID=180332 RepID=UPI0036380B3F
MGLVDKKRFVKGDSVRKDADAGKGQGLHRLAAKLAFSNLPRAFWGGTREFIATLSSDELNLGIKKTTSV